LDGEHGRTALLWHGFDHGNPRCAKPGNSSVSEAVVRDACIALEEIPIIIDVDHDIDVGYSSKADPLVLDLAYERRRNRDD